jgi:uncharacterized integral membrane protein (TIGR00697 family)
MSNYFFEQKRITLFVVLTGIFITNAILAEIIGAKIFSLEDTLGLSPAQIPIFGAYTLDFNLSAGVVLWPVVFVTSDIINEYFGQRGVRRISFLVAALIAYMFVAVWSITKLAPAQFWLGLYATDSHGNPSDINEAFNNIFGQGLGIIIGSLVAFLIGQLIDVFVFHWLRRRTGEGKIWLRATGSTLVSQLIDSFVVLFLAFYVFGRMELSQVLAIGVINYIYKFAIAVLATPLVYVAHYLIDGYLGKENAQQMIAEAAQGKLKG